MIVVKHLTKTYRRKLRQEGLRGALLALFSREYESVDAIKDLSFQINPGEIVGYLGLNGAGKSTTVKILSGVLYPSDGLVTVGGVVPYKERRRHVQNIGVVFGQRSQLWWDLPTTESFRLLASIYNISPGTYKKRLEQFTYLLEMQAFLATPVRQLSLGQRMRAELVAALLHEPKLLLLDEPTIGLDLFAKQAIRKFLADSRRELGLTVLLASHDLSDIESVCDRVMLLDKGQLIFDDSISNLRSLYAGVFTVEFTFSKIPSTLQVLPGVRSWDWQGNLLRVTVGGQNSEVSRLVRYVTDLAEYRDVKIREPSLELVVQSLYEQRLKRVGAWHN